MKTLRISKIAALALMLVVAFTLAACGGGDDKESKSGSSDAKEIKVTLGDDPTRMWTDPESITVASGEEVVLDVTNDGTTVHNLALEGGPSTADLPKFSTAKLELGELTESTVAYCTIPGHREQGMELEITVE